MVSFLKYFIEIINVNIITLFRVKKRFSRVRKRNRVTKLLIETADEDLTPLDKRKKKQIIRVCGELIIVLFI